MVVVAARCIDQLREATRVHHEALDAALRLDSPAAYTRFLAATLAAVEALEPEIDRAIPGFGADRVTALRADREELGGPPVTPLACAPFASASVAFGAAYVLEGSALGGLVLADRVEAIGITATRYLRLRGPATAGRWRQFLGALEAGVADRAACCDAAIATFARYERAFRAASVL